MKLGLDLINICKAESSVPAVEHTITDAVSTCTLYTCLGVN